MTHKNYVQEQYYWFQTYSYWFGTYSYWIIGSTTPAIVSSPLRSVIVKPEDREIDIDAEMRIVVVETEDREFTNE